MHRRLIFIGNFFVLLLPFSVLWAMEERLTYNNDDFLEVEKPFYLPNAPEKNCANTVLDELEEIFTKEEIPFVKENGKRRFEGCNGTFFYPRDAAARDSKGRILVPNQKTLEDGAPTKRAIDFGKILERSKIFFAKARPKTESCISHLRQNSLEQILSKQANILGGGLYYNLGLVDNLMGLKVEPNQFRQSLGMHDGGNSFILSNKNGKRRLIVGEAEVIYNWVFLRERGFFSDGPLKNFKLDFEQLKRLKGLLADKKVSEWIENEKPATIKSLSEGQKNTWHMISYHMGYNPKYKNGKGTKDDSVIATVIAQREFVTKVLLPLDYDLEPEEVVVVPQVFYHLDLYLAPLLEGQVLIPDFKGTIDVLTKLAQRLNANEGKNEILALAHHSGEFEKIYENQEKLKKLEEKLIIAGFDVIMAPLFAVSGNRHLISGFNPIYGISPKSKKAFWFVSGISLGGRNTEIVASEKIMSEFEAILRKSVFKDREVEVKFVGKSRDDRSDPFSDCRLLHQKWAGLHCLSATVDK